VAAIARILTVNRCLDHLVKSRTPGWFRGTALPWIMDAHPDSINTSRIFRELAVIEGYKESICEHLYKKFCLEDPEVLRSVFYGLSSATFSGSCCVLMKWGRCKEGYGHHVVLALVVNRDGLPFYWEVLPGGTSEMMPLITVKSRGMQTAVTFSVSIRSCFGISVSPDVRPLPISSRLWT